MPVLAIDLTNNLISRISRLEAAAVLQQVPLPILRTSLSLTMTKTQKMTHRMLISIVTLEMVAFLTTSTPPVTVRSLLKRSLGNSAPRKLKSIGRRSKLASVRNSKASLTSKSFVSSPKAPPAIACQVVGFFVGRLTQPPTSRPSKHG